MSRLLAARMCCCAVVLLIISGRAAAAPALPLDKIKLSPGFAISVFADNVPTARAMVMGDNGTVFVGRCATA